MFGKRREFTFLVKVTICPTREKSQKKLPENEGLPCRIQYRQIFAFFDAPVGTFEIAKKS